MKVYWYSINSVTTMVVTQWKSPYGAMEAFGPCNGGMGEGLRKGAFGPFASSPAGLGIVFAMGRGGAKICRPVPARQLCWGPTIKLIG